MLSLRLCQVLFLVFLHCINGQRRITDGRTVQEDKGYMVFLTQAQTSPHDYDTWICGGCIVAKRYILSSAACVEDVQFMYAIAGTKKYIPRSEINKNNCSKNTKRKVVSSCVPREYNLTYSEIKSWAANDIAILKVEEPYDFSDPDEFKDHCDFVPSMILMNYDLEKEKTITDVIVVGYGHRTYWRNPNITTDMNEKDMQFVSTRIYSNDECKKFYKSPDLTTIIDKYMICTDGIGTIDENFEPLNKTKKNFRRIQNRSKFTMRSKKNNSNSTYNLKTRRHGICQNDHGGPLIAWIDGYPTVIGIASVFRVSEGKCVGPYLFTSTARFDEFLKCTANPLRRRSEICNRPPEKRGFSILRRHYSWNEYEDHVADNEEIKIRPQINMNFVGMG